MTLHSGNRGAPPNGAPGQAFILGAFLIFAAAGLRSAGPGVVLWAAPCILFAAILIAWAAESAQFFIAQGFALAILAWMQTLPEFAVEAVLAWRQQVPFLLANLTGALRLLTGLGWPAIYFAAAFVHRKRTGQPLRRIVIEKEQSVEVAGLFLPVCYAAVIWWKGSLNLVDAVVLVALYSVYLYILSHLPPEQEGLEELESIPRMIVLSPRPRRIALISLCFLAGGALIYFSAEPFLAGLLSLAAIIGIPSFIFIQWVAPLVSEFPEMASTFYWAKTVTRAPMALMNMVSSNINQWTLLAAMLPVIYSVSRGVPSVIALDSEQELELLMTIAQALVGFLFLLNLELAWWEALVLFVLWVVQFGFSAVPPTAPGLFGYLAKEIRTWVTIAYLAWAALEIARLVLGKRKPAAFTQFASLWREHVRG